MDTVCIGHIFDMQRFCTHDGPGIRTTFFLKGCPLRCAWCSNPESQLARPQLMFHVQLCKSCGRCASVCPAGAIRQDGADMLFDRSQCTDCGSCAAVCPTNARVLSGRTITLEEAVQFAREDWRYYMQSGGGITCSGGEALAQPDFLRALFARLHDGLGYHTCLDTTAHAAWDTVESVLPVTDMILLDIKHMDSAQHKSMTGVGNEQILSNARKLGAMRFPVVIRVPLIPGFNDTSENIKNLGEFLDECHFSSVELMPYHTFGRSKYDALGRSYAAFPNKPKVEDTVALLRHYGLTVTVHSVS